MDINFSEDEHEAAAKLNEFLHGLLGYNGEDGDGVHAWHSVPFSKIQVALDCSARFQKLHSKNFIEEKWKSKLDKFPGSCKSNGELSSVQMNRRVHCEPSPMLANQMPKPQQSQLQLTRDTQVLQMVQQAVWPPRELSQSLKKN